MSDTDFSTDLQELYNLADALLGGMEATGAMILRTEPTLYAQTGKKPGWPYWASWSFQQLWDAL